jgi:hypothetical protein
MKYITLMMALVFLAACNETPSQAYVKNARLEQQLLEILNDSATQFYYTKDKIPNEMQRKAKEVAALTGNAYPGMEAMANPGEKFQLGCCSLDALPLPLQRLVFVADLQDKHVVCYESGGFAHTLYLGFSERKDGAWSYEQGNLTGVADYTQLSEIKQGLEEGRFLVKQGR